MQDIEFTIENGKLYILQTRNGKRTATAAVKIAVDMVEEGLIDKETAILRIEPDQINQLLHPTFDTEAVKKAQQHVAQASTKAKAKAKTADSQSVKAETSESVKAKESVKIIQERSYFFLGLRIWCLKNISAN